MSFEPVPYTHGTLKLTGKLAVPAGAPRGAVLVFPTIANGGARTDQTLNDLAAAGYLAFQADLYGFVPESFDASFAFGLPLKDDCELYRGRARAAEEALRGVPQAAGLKLAAIGYCMGGTAALELARIGSDLVAVVAYHADVKTQKAAEPGAVKAKVLVCNGDADPSVPHEAILGFWGEMNAAGADWTYTNYAGVKHGFTEAESDSRGRPEFLAYDASADRQSWAATLALFDEVF